LLKKLGGLANHKRESWKMPLPEYVEYLFEKRFGKPMPHDIRSLEAMDVGKRKKKGNYSALTTEFL